MESEAIIYRAFVETPVGTIKIEATDRAILSLVFVSERGPAFKNALCEKACEALREYFSGKRKTFDLPLEKASSSFAEKVYAETKKSPLVRRPLTEPLLGPSAPPVRRGLWGQPFRKIPT